MAAVAPDRSRWLFGPAPDLLLGCGVLYALVLLLFSVFGSEARVLQATWLIPMLVLLLGAPHYGATLVRVYEERESRRTYALFAVHATLVIAAFFAVSLFSQAAATWLVTIYLTWSPWHYTGQNYGLAVMFLRRAGVEPSRNEKRLVYASFVLPFLLIVLVFHGGTGGSPSPESTLTTALGFHSLGIPRSVTDVAIPLLFVVYLGALVASGVMLLRRGRPSDLLPAGALVLTQALWFAVPVAARQWQIFPGIEPLDWRLRPYYVFWIGLGHAVQYLWVTTYYARGSSGWHGYSRYLGKVLLAGVAIWTLPLFVLDPKAIGMLPNTAELALLVAAAVNVHHFVLDGAIWKLRNMKIASVLIRSAPPSDEPAPASESWGRRAVWGFAAIGLALAAFRFTNEQVLFPRAIERRDYAAARGAIDRLSWFYTIPDSARASIDQQERAQQRGRRVQRRAAQQRVPY